VDKERPGVYPRITKKKERKMLKNQNIMKRLEKIHYEKGSTNPLSVSTLKEAFDPGYNYYINAIGNKIHIRRK